MKAGWIRLAVGLSVSGLMAARAGVEFTPVTAESLQAADSPLARLGAEAGDVRLANDFVQLVVRAGKGARDASGSALVLPPGDLAMAPGTPYRPGPAVAWKNPKYRKDSLQAAVRFEAGGEGWRAHLEYAVADKSPWVTVHTVVINADDQRPLHLPLVDGFAPFADGKVENLSGAALVVGDEGKYPPAFALVPVSDAKAHLEKGSGGRWYLGLVGAKEREEQTKKSRVPFFNRTPSGPNKPIPADRDQGRFRDEDSWVRIAPGGRLEFERRLISSFGKAETRSIVELARQEASGAPEKELVESAAPKGSTAPVEPIDEPADESALKTVAAASSGSARGEADPRRQRGSKTPPAAPANRGVAAPSSRGDADRTAAAEPTPEQPDRADRNDAERGRRRKFPFNLFGRKKDDEPSPSVKAPPKQPSGDSTGRAGNSVAAKPPTPPARPSGPTAPARPSGPALTNRPTPRPGPNQAAGNRDPAVEPLANGRGNVPQVASRPDRSGGRLIQGNQRGTAPNRTPPAREPDVRRGRVPATQPAADGLGPFGAEGSARTATNAAGRTSPGMDREFAELPPTPRPIATEGRSPRVITGQPRSAGTPEVTPAREPRVITGQPRSEGTAARREAAPAGNARPEKPAGGMTAQDRANLESILRLPDPTP